jgi:hypothetical protein
MEEEKKKRGAQPGNRNARTHGFYAKELDETEKVEYLLAVKVEGLDYEIALMRVKIKTLIARDAGNIRLITQAANSLARLLVAKQSIDKKDKNEVKEAFQNVAKRIGSHFGAEKDIVDALNK